MTEIVFLWLFTYAFVWWLVWFLVLPLRNAKDKSKGEGELSAKFLRQKVLIVSLLAALLTTLLFVALASRN